ncbi:hypothetical protein [Paenibacillus illinoisensis]|uniref:hypothetical protein n=1 Tax=Paenibacillus illinoisensis TaxID=59845 RepID=UPI00301921ED
MSNSIIYNKKYYDKIANFMNLGEKSDFEILLYGHDYNHISQFISFIFLNYKVINPKINDTQFNESLNTFIYPTTILDNYPNKQKTKVIIFEENYYETVNFLISIGFNPFEQIYDGLIMLGVKDEPNLDKTTRLVFTGAGQGDVGGIFTYNFDHSKFDKVVEGDFRDLKPYKNGYLAIDDNVGLIQYDNQFRKINEIIIKNMDLHGFDIDPKNENIVYLVETATDIIGIYNLSTGQKIDELLFSGEKSIDKHHINDILVTEQSVYLSLFSLNGLFDRSAWQGDGAIIRLSREKKGLIEEVLLHGLDGPHTIINFADDIIFCDSLNRRVFRNEKILCEFNGFVRGLYFNGHSLFVAQSKKRRIIDTAHKFNNNAIQSGIHIYHISSKTSSFIPTPFTKNIYSIIAE